MIAGAASLLLAQAAAATAPKVDDVAYKAARKDGDTVARDRACIALAPDRAYEGLYLDAFEGQRFFEDVTNPADLPERWDVTIDQRPGAIVRAATFPASYVAPLTYRPRLFRVRFIGAAPVEGACQFGGHPLRLCYGHMGMVPQLVVADRILSAEYVGDLPEQQGDRPQLR